MKKRYEEIDLLRGIAMFAIILIHACYYFISDKTALFLWKWSQFAVPVFVFCASYLFFQKPAALSPGYLKKRSVRLFKTYYIFLIFFIPMFFVLNPTVPKTKYLLQSILVIGGVDINWLVLLFVYLMILFPIIYLFFKKSKLLFLIYSIAAIGSSILLIFYKIPLHYKYTLWLPWSVVPIFTLAFVLNENKKHFKFFIIFISGLLFAASYALLFMLDHNLGFIENKYPPNIYFLSYGLFMITVIYLLSKFILRIRLIKRFFSFMSLYSYPIYFIHYFFLIALASRIKLFPNWQVFFTTVLTLTLLTQLGINKLTKRRI